jgi:hypothetical protein
LKANFDARWNRIGTWKANIKVIVFCHPRKLHSSTVHIVELHTFLTLQLNLLVNIQCIHWIYVHMFVSCITCASPISMILINLWMLDFVWHQNMLCNKQQVKTYGKKYIGKSDLVSDSWKVFFIMPKAFSTTKQPTLCFLL